MTVLEERVAPAAVDPPPTPGPDRPPPPWTPGPWPVRTALAVALPVVGAGVMVGGIFQGAVGRVDACVAGVLGVALAVLLSRARRASVVNAGVLLGVLLIGLVLILPNGFDAVVHVADEVRLAGATSHLKRPPVPLDPGWQAIIGWAMALVGVVVAWIAVVLKRTGLAILIAMPVTATAAISVPKDAQIASGLAVLALLGVAFVILAVARRAEEADEENPLTPGAQVRRTLRALPLIGIVTAGLYGLAQANVLFPAPAIDPSHKPQKPHAVPLTKVPDRVLFTVKSSVTGPWRIGSLDVYDGTDWLLPPYSESKFVPVPGSGIVNPDLDPGVKATITIGGLTGSTLPGLPNLYAIVASGPRVVYDSRIGNVRIDQGEVQGGFSYTVAAASIPSIEKLRRVPEVLPESVKEFTQVPARPPAVTALLAKAPHTSAWDTFDYLRNWVLNNVVVSGAGAPVSIPPSRVQEILTTKKGSPFEIVAVQALLARWAGVPSRIGYGFDGGDEVGGALEVHPRNGATYVEVYFDGYGWLPVIGTPKHAEASLSNDQNQQVNSSVLPSKDIAVQLFIPQPVPPSGTAGRVLARVVEIALPILALLLLVYFAFPALRKAILRGRRRRLATAAGPRARVAVAYAEWRDLATDLGFGRPSDTPLAYLQRFVPDPAHRQLAWLVTRSLWGDLRDRVGVDDAVAAEALSRDMRRRLAQAQPFSLRAIAVISRLSLRSPYLEELGDVFTSPARAEKGVDRELSTVG